MKCRLALVAALITLPWLAGSGCPGTAESQGFTGREKTTILSARMTAAALAEAAGITQAPADINPSGAVVPAELSFGTCPIITTSLAQGGLSVSVNFGITACTPDLFPDLTCTGSATGTYNAGASTIALEFTAVGCNSRSLNGTAEVGFSLGQTGVSLDGTFDLSWISEGLITAINGAGQFQHDRTAKATTVSSFSGTFATNDGSYSTVCTALVVSYQNNANLIPSAGTIEIVGPGIRSMVILFDENSPSTGTVQITINGRETVEANVLAP